MGTVSIDDLGLSALSSEIRPKLILISALNPVLIVQVNSDDPKINCLLHNTDVTPVYEEFESWLVPGLARSTDSAT